MSEKISLDSSVVIAMIVNSMNSGLNSWQIN